MEEDLIKNGDVKSKDGGEKEVLDGGGANKRWLSWVELNRAHCLDTLHHLILVSFSSSSSSVGSMGLPSQSSAHPGHRL